MRLEEGSNNNRTSLGFFPLKVTKLCMKNLAPGFAHMSNNNPDLM